MTGLFGGPVIYICQGKYNEFDSRKTSAEMSIFIFKFLSIEGEKIQK
jgi:hypothetical protein